MSKKNDQSDLGTSHPIQGLSLRDMASIWDSGKKLTRGAKQQLKQSFSEKQIGEKQSQVSFDSKKSIETKKDLKKTDKNAKKKEGSVKPQKVSISEYLGVPDLQTYIASEDLVPKTHYSLEKFAIGQLGKNHLPSLMRVILKNNLSKEHYEVRRGELKKQKTTKEQFLIDLSFSSGGRSDVRSITKDNGIVMVGENLAMMKVDFETWKEMFESQIEDFQKEMAKSIEEEECSNRIEEEKEENEKIVSEKVDEANYENKSNLIEAFSMNDIQINAETLKPPVLQQSSVRIQEQKSLEFVQIQQNHSSQILSSENQDEKDPISRREENSSANNWNELKQEKAKENFDQRELFYKFCIPGSEFALWPVMIYETVIGDGSEAFEIIRKKQYGFSDKDKVQHMFETIAKSGIFQHQGPQFKSQSHISQGQSDEEYQNYDQFSQTFLKTVVPQISNPIVPEKSNPSQINLIVYPFGSGKFVVLESVQQIQGKLVTWDKFPRGFLSFYFSQSSFKESQEEIAYSIEKLNQFSRWQIAECKIEEIRNSIDRLIKCKINQRIYNGITLRYSNIQKKVLVLVFKNCQSTQNELIWLNLDEISPNYTLPQLNIKNKFLLYFSNLESQSDRSLTTFIQDMYTSFFYNPISNLIFAKSYYQISSLPCLQESPISITDRCVQCIYPIRKLPFYRCCFCEKFCHKQCSKNALNKSIQSNFQGFQGLWTCTVCEPCTLCLQPLNNKRMSCMKCTNMFHQICGKLKIQENTLHRDRYLCENCIQCKICEKKLKNQDYNVLNDGSYQCSSCQEAQKNDEACHICKKGSDGKWAQCSRDFCGKWIHKNCDKYIQSRSNIFLNNNEEIYFCPFCRRAEKRRIVLKFIEVLTVFDEYQYFIGSDYEDLLDYKYVIMSPMCFRKMYERCHDGAYDENTKENLLRDFDLLISNALKYNMPKDQPHYQARILNILGSHAIEKFHSILECTEEDLIKGGLLSALQEKRRELHKEIYDRYLEIILNYKSIYSTVEVKKPKQATSKGEKLSHYHLNDGEHFAFSSRHLLKQVFKSSMLKFKTSKKAPTISNLFEIQKVIEAYKCSIKESFCYYHYWNSNVIFYCAICMEHYCCTTKCYKHHVCTNCGVKGCACDMSECGCPPLKEKERKMYEKLIHERYYERRQITENYSLCLRCACEKLTTKVCCYCQKAYEFYYDFQTCQTCKKVYHKQCADVHASQHMSKYFFKKEKQFPNQELFSSNHRLERACYECSVGSKNKDKMYEKLKAESFTKLKKLQKLGKFQPLISSIYQENGIKINLNEILMLILNNYDEFLEYECLFEEYKMNLSSTRLNSKQGQRAEERVEMLIREQVFNKMNEIKTETKNKCDLLKVNPFSSLYFGYGQEGKIVGFGEPQRVWKEKQILKAKEFMVKRVILMNGKEEQNMKRVRMQFMLEQYEKLRSVNKTIKLDDQKQKINVVNIISLPSKKNTAMGAQSSEKLSVWSKSHVQNSNMQKSLSSKSQLVEEKGVNLEWLLGMDERMLKTFTELESEAVDRLREESWRREREWKQCLLVGGERDGLGGVFRIRSPIVYEKLKYQRQEEFIDQELYEQGRYEENHQEKLVQKQSPIKIMSSHQRQHQQQQQPQQQQEIPCLTTLSSQLQFQIQSIQKNYQHKIHSPNPHSLSLQQKLMKIHLTHTNLSKISKYKRISTLHQIITKFLLTSFEMNKQVYRRGNTCILKAQNTHWRVLKKGKHKHQLYQITLKKQQDKWFFSINENTWWIQTIQQIINKLKPLVQISNFRQLADFLGFTFKFIPLQKATHFTRFLQTNPLQNMTPHNKKKVILQLYDKIDWLRSGSFKNKAEPGKDQNKEYVTTKRKLFYLSKRKSKGNEEKESAKQVSQPPYISFEDLKKDLDDAIQSKKMEALILTEPGENVFIGPSPIHKLGLFAKRDFPKHTTMVEYIGEVLSESMADVRQTRFQFGCYMFGLNRRNCDKREIIDATFKGNMARYLNHSCDPNCKARIEMVRGEPSIFIYSIRDIGQFEELTYDYQFSVDGEEKLVCTCGAKNCQGRLN